MKRQTTIATVGAGIVLAACARTVGQPATATPGASDTLGTGGASIAGDGKLDVSGGGPRPAASASATSTSTGTGTGTGTSTGMGTSTTWANVPRSAGASGLYPLLDGACRKMWVSVIENETIFTAGGMLGRITDDGAVVDKEMNDGLFDDIHDVVGRWPDALYVRRDNGGRCTFGYYASHYEASQKKWRRAFALPEGHGIESMVSVGSGALGVQLCWESCGDSSLAGCKDGIFVGDNAKAPPMTGDGFRPVSFKTMPTGEVFAVGVVCPKDVRDKCAGQFRWWSPGSKVGYMPLGTASYESGSLVARSKTEVYVAQGSYFGVFDGTKLTKLPVPPNPTGLRLHDAGPAGLWLATDDKLWERKPDGTFGDVSPPTFGGASLLAGVAVGAPWYLAGYDRYSSNTGKRVLYKRVAGAWQVVDLPKPSRASNPASYLTPEVVAVRAPDDVLVVGSYFEMPAGWNEAEKRRVLLRTKPPKQTLRCANGGVEPWPAAANDACTTPFVLLAEVSTQSPKNFDYPQTRAVLGPKAALVVDQSIAEIRENGRLWIGVVPRTVADGKKLVEAYASQHPLAKPEVVCAQPQITRRVPLVK